MTTSIFHILKPAPTQQAIDHLVAKGERLLKRIYCLALAGVVVMAIGFLGVWLADLAGQSHQGRLSEVASYVFWGGVAWTALALLASYDLRTETPWAPIPQASCAEMRLHCNSSDQARAYADSVLAQGRQFVISELHMMQDARGENWTDAECKALYAIPT